MKGETRRMPDEPGWYTDPDGNYQHQQYWDGQTWTGNYRREPTTLPRTKRTGVGTWVLAIIGGFLAGIVAVTVASYLDLALVFGVDPAVMSGLIHIAIWVLVGIAIVQVRSEYQHPPS